MRNLVLVLGDQLDLDSSAFDGFDPAQDAVWMAEVLEESRHVWSSQPRSALFLSAMRHFAAQLRAQGRPLHYRALDDADNRGSLAAELRAAIVRLQPRQLVLTAPGDWRVLQDLQAVARETGSGARAARGPPLLQQRARIRPARPRPQAAAPGVLVPRAAPPPRRAADPRG
jgi:deoxyribodipyrimidine photolyase-related protein